jgi:hypothetical protein
LLTAPTARLLQCDETFVLQLADPVSRSQRLRPKRCIARALNGSTVRPDVEHARTKPTPLEAPNRELRVGRFRRKVFLITGSVPARTPHQFPSRSLLNLNASKGQETWMVQIQSGGRVASDGSVCARVAGALRHGNHITHWMTTCLVNGTVSCPLLTAFRTLQPSHRRGMQQRQGYTFTIVGVLWRRLFDAVDRVWIAQGTAERQQVFCQMCG